MHKTVAVVFSLGVAMLASHPVPVFADEPKSGRPDSFTLTIKGGAVRLADDEQAIAGTARHFDDSPNNFLAIEGETRFRGENIAVGGELMRYSNNFRRSSVTGNEDRMRVYSLVAKAKYFLGNSDTWQPYVGGGIGWVQAHDFGGPIEGLADGLALQGVFGLQVRTDRVGVRAELFVHRGSVDDDKGDEIDTTIRGAMLGVSFFFGPKRPR